MTQVEGRSLTMADVARLAGVSVPTVSRVLSGTIRVSPEKRERVERAVAELRYRPSAAARTLASGRSDIVAVVAGDTSRYGYAEAIRGVEEAARAAGYTVMIAVVETPDKDDVERAMSTLVNQSVAGVVVLKFDRPGVLALQHVPAGLPVVALSGLREPHVAQAVLDEARAAEALTAYLLELGHATVYHVRVPPSRREDGRTTGWRRALRKAGAPAPPPIDASWDPRSGRAIGRRLATVADATAIFCGNDEIAMGVMRGLFDKGARVPDDVSVAGFDDHPLAELWTPGLTTVRQDFADLGRRGFALLEEQIDRREASGFSSEVPPLIIRESTASPR